MLVKVGIIGFGYMGHFHLNKAKQIDDTCVTAVFDISNEKLLEAEEENIEVFRTLEEFLNANIDLVVICTPNNWHAKYAIAAMKAGKHVMCEKPATMTVAELEEVINCSKETGKFFTVHQNRRWDIDYQIVHDTVINKKVGQITTIESRVFGERGVCYGWRADAEAGGGMLYDWGVHLIDQMLIVCMHGF